MTVVVVDVGAANTVAVDGTGGPVVVDGAPWIPSVDGADALRLGRPAERDVRAVLTRVMAAAGSAVDELVLTHPVGQGAELVAAAQGLAPRVGTVAAPVAVAAGAGLARGQELLVVDVGATTCAVSLVRRERQGYTTVDSAVLPADFDQRILDRLAPSLREPVTSARDRQRLHDSARAAKELLSRHDRADIVLPDHRVVRLTRVEFEELIAPDVERVVALARSVAAPMALVGGASRVPLLARRLAEATGRPVRVDPEPETAVARGAATLVATPAPAHRPKVAIAGLVLALLLVVALLVVPGPRTSGRAVAGAAPPDAASSGPPPTIPPAVAGTEVVNAERPAYDDHGLGEPVTYRHPSGTELDLVFDRVETRPAVPGYRWLFVQFRATHVDGPEWRDPFAATAGLDDRGHRIRGGAVACDGTDKPVTTIPPGATVEVCGVLPVPERTPVEALVFGDRNPARILTSVVAVPGAGPAPASIAGRLGGPAVTVDLDGTALTATFDLVVTPSGYLADRRPAAGTRMVVLRASLGPADREIYLRDDRGVLTPPLDAGDLPDCARLTCLVYEVDLDTPIAGVTVGRPLDEDADLTAWPTWTP